MSGVTDQVEQNAGLYERATAVHQHEPHCIEIEQALLGSILSYDDAYFQVADFLRPQHFIENAHARIFEACAAMREEGRRCNVLTVIPLFRDDTDIKELEISPALYIARLAGAAAPLLSVKEYGRFIYEYAQRRRIEALALGLVDEARNVSADGDVMDIVSHAVRAFTEDEGLARDRIKRTRFGAGEVMDAIVDRVNAQYRDGTPQEKHPFCGSGDLNGVLGGWKRKRFYVIGGRPGMGKSTATLSWLIRTAERGHGVLFLSLEMEATELGERMLSDLCYRHDAAMTYEQIGRNDLNEFELERLINASAERAKLPLEIDERSKPSLGQIRIIAQQVAQRMAAQGGRLDVLCIDHMGLIALPERDGDSQSARIEELTGGLKAMAKDLDIAVIGLSQLSRASEHRDDKRPQLSDLRNSGGIEQDADVVMLLYREAYYLERRKETDPDKELVRQSKLQEKATELEVIIAKNRGGQSKTLTFFAHMGACAVRDMDIRYG